MRTASTEQGSRQGDEQAIHALLERQAKAWNDADADAFGETFTEDSRYIAFFGGIYRGRSEIVASHRLLWKGILKGTRMHTEVLEIRFVNPDVAIVITRGEVAKRPPKRLPKVQSQVAVRDREAQWRFAHFQNTKRLRAMEWLTYRLGVDAIPSLDR
ncbi:SgcJ/EcaC family oxidoreductase [Pendulispora brunnea]|uniref:SgcJ/EcaC family oxidoreductase n=1 Tax=Pendulispora brunnea TaxID=2905690 RepID=A0ABZ2KT72_9BACT